MSYSYLCSCSSVRAVLRQYVISHQKVFLQNSWNFGRVLCNGLFSFYENQQAAANMQDFSVGWFFRDAQGFERVDADSRASFSDSRPPPPRTSVLQFSLFRRGVTLRNLDFLTSPLFPIGITNSYLCFFLLRFVK